MFFTRAVATVTLLALSSLSAQTVAESPPPREQTTTHDPESTTERTPQTSCKLKGCHPVLGYHADDPCQCDEQCTNDGSCCDDYASQVKSNQKLFVCFLHIYKRKSALRCVYVCMRVCRLYNYTRTRYLLLFWGGLSALVCGMYNKHLQPNPCATHPALYSVSKRITKMGRARRKGLGRTQRQSVLKATAVHTAKLSPPAPQLAGIQAAMGRVCTASVSQPP